MLACSLEGDRVRARVPPAQEQLLVTLRLQWRRKPCTDLLL